MYVVTRFRRNPAFANDVSHKTVVADVNPRLPYLRPRESGDVVTELLRLDDLVTDTWLYGDVHIITHQSSKDVNAWHTRIQDVLANSKEDISQYLTIVTTRGEPVLLPGKLYSIISFMLSWLRVMSSVDMEVVSEAMEALLSRDRRILWNTISLCITHAKDMWIYGMMTAEWSPYILGVTTTYWDIIGVLDPTIWTSIMGASVPTWMKLSCNPCMSCIYRFVVSANHLT